jgi:hypothetical protein
LFPLLESGLKCRGDVGHFDPVGEVAADDDQGAVTAGGFYGGEFHAVIPGFSAFVFRCVPAVTIVGHIRILL